MGYGTILLAAFISTLANVIGPILAPIIQAYFCKYFTREKERVAVTDDRSIRINIQPQTGTPEGIQTVSHKRSQTDLKGIIGKLGPWGDTKEGKRFDHNNGYDGIKTIKLGWDSTRIVYLKVQYTKDGKLEWTDGVGSERRINKEFEIELEDGEYVSEVRGYHDRSNEIGMIKSLTFVTNKKVFGPYGDDAGIAFHVEKQRGRIAGFYGRAGFFLSSIGVIISPLPIY